MILQYARRNTQSSGYLLVIKLRLSNTHKASDLSSIGNPLWIQSRLDLLIPLWKLRGMQTIRRVYGKTRHIPRLTPWSKRITEPYIGEWNCESGGVSRRSRVKPPSAHSHPKQHARSERRNHHCRQGRPPPDPGNHPILDSIAIELNVGKASFFHRCSFHRLAPRCSAANPFFFGVVGR